MLDGIGICASLVLGQDFGRSLGLNSRVVI